MPFIKIEFERKSSSAGRCFINAKECVGVVVFHKLLQAIPSEAYETSAFRSAIVKSIPYGITVSKLGRL